MQNTNHRTLQSYWNYVSLRTSERQGREEHVSAPKYVWSGDTRTMTIIVPHNTRVYSFPWTTHNSSTAVVFFGSVFPSPIQISVACCIWIQNAMIWNAYHVSKMVMILSSWSLIASRRWSILFLTKKTTDALRVSILFFLNTGFPPPSSQIGTPVYLDTFGGHSGNYLTPA